MTSKRMPAPGKKLLTKDICDLYQISPRTVDRWVADGHLPLPTTIGRIRRWDSDELALMERKRMDALSSEAQ
jgi:predicted DNA-binding transcriptional regulator AlpA